MACVYLSNNRKPWLEKDLTGKGELKGKTEGGTMRLQQQMWSKEGEAEVGQQGEQAGWRGWGSRLHSHVMASRWGVASVVNSFHGQPLSASCMPRTT